MLWNFEVSPKDTHLLRQVFPYIPGLKAVVYTRVVGLELGQVLKFALCSPVQVHMSAKLSCSVRICHVMAAAVTGLTL